jgi:uncharacterized protein (TIGR03382 family)
MHGAMKLAVLPIGLALFAGCFAGEAELGQTHQRIVNGQINAGDPAVGLIVIPDAACTGTLVSKRVVLTARHCVGGLDDSSVVVPAADIFLLWGSEPDGNAATPVASVEVHPSADIAVLELAAPAPAEPIPMNTTALEPYIGASVRIAGYGVTGEDLEGFGLKRLGLTQVFGIDDSEIGRAVLVGNVGSQTCYGDSGGPAFMTFDGTEKIVGVTSFGTGACDDPTTIDGEMRVDVYHSWILDFIMRKDPNGLPGDLDSPPPPAQPDTTDPGDGASPPDEPQVPSPEDAADASPIVGGCSTTGDASGVATALMLALGLALVRRRRTMVTASE